MSITPRKPADRISPNQVEPMAEGQTGGIKKFTNAIPFSDSTSMHGLAKRTKHTGSLRLSILLSRRQPARVFKRSMLSILEMNSTGGFELNRCVSDPEKHFCPIASRRWSGLEGGHVRNPGCESDTGSKSSLKLPKICGAGGR
jgi:hypothetical protein